jgi:hypothetical protein
MATITSPEYIKKLLCKHGKDEGYDWVLIYKYQNVHNGETAFSIFNDARYDDMYQSPYVGNPVLLMERGWLTTEGAEFLGVDQNEFNSKVAEEKSFYRTVIQVEILSDGPYEFSSLEDTAQDVMNGDCSGKVEVISSEEVSKKEMAKLLESQESDPSFLGICDDDIDDERLF